MVGKQHDVRGIVDPLGLEAIEESQKRPERAPGLGNRTGTLEATLPSRAVRLQDEGGMGDHRVDHLRGAGGISHDRRRSEPPESRQLPLRAVHEEGLAGGGAEQATLLAQDGPAQPVGQHAIQTEVEKVQRKEELGMMMMKQALAHTGQMVASLGGGRTSGQ